MKQQSIEELYLFQKPIWNWVSLFILLVTAIAIRIYGLNEPPLDFHPVKQYRSALTARAYYYEDIDTVQGWQREVSRDVLQRIGILVPPMMDAIAAKTYLVAGAEYLWIPKLFSALSWVIGGVFLYLIALTISSPEPALFATAFYLLLPFAVVASQSFQPDPIMIMMMLISLYSIIEYDRFPTRKRLFIAAIVTGIAISIKPVTLFIIYGAFIALALHKYSFRQAILNYEYWLFGFISLIPTVLYYGYGIFIAGFLAQQAEKSFLPQLLLRFDFWDGWLKRVRIVMGFTYFLGGMIGALIFRESKTRYLVLGMWIGYFVMCFVFTYTISTHDYYHLPLVPIVALSLTAIASAVLNHFHQYTTHWFWRLAMLGILFVALFLSAGTSIQARGKLPKYDRDINIAREIGEIVGHSTQTIHLALYDGKPLMYYGEFSGNYWPYRFDIRDEKLWGVAEMSAEKRFNILSLDGAAKYFIVTDLQEFEAQEDLKTFLITHFDIFVEDEDYIIFDLHD